VGYLDGLHLSWAEEDPNGQGPTGVCIRTGTMQILEDAQTSPIFGPWRERARQFGIRSSVSIPLRIKGSWHGALVVYSARPKAFEAAPVEVFERLGEHIVHGIQAIKQKRLLDAERRHLEETQKHLTDALAASVSAMVTAMEIRDPTPRVMKSECRRSHTPLARRWAGRRTDCRDCGWRQWFTT